MDKMEEGIREPSDWNFSPFKVNGEMKMNARSTVRYSLDYVNIITTVRVPFLVQEMDSLLRCPICKDYLNNAMIVPHCSHNCKCLRHRPFIHT